LRADIAGSPLVLARFSKGVAPMKKDMFRVVTRGSNGELRIRDYDNQDALLKRHTQIGVDDCSTDLDLRGLPVFRGLIGPMPEGQSVIRYESPEVFETLTKEWGSAKAPRRSRTRPPIEVANRL
jgi:hypothetical protein